MSLKWIFALLVVSYASNVFAKDIEFAPMLAEGYQTQFTIAAEVQNQLQIQNEKTLRADAPKGFNTSKE